MVSDRVTWEEEEGSLALTRGMWSWELQRVLEPESRIMPLCMRASLLEAVGPGILPTVVTAVLATAQHFVAAVHSLSHATKLSLRPHELQHTRLLDLCCLSGCSNWSPLSW